MRLYEYEVKKIFQKIGIPIPNGATADNAVEARKIAERVGKPVVIKAQVLVGARGKAGGIRFAENPLDGQL